MPDGPDRPTARGTPIRFRGGGFQLRRRPRIAAVGLIGLLVLWQLAGMAGVISPIFLPTPSSVVRALVELWQAGTAWTHVSASLGRIGGGWAIGTAAGLAVGVTMGILSSVRAAGLPIVSALFPIPKIALLPLLILWFGIGEPSKLATIAAGVFFPTVISTFTSIDSVPRSLIAMAQSFNLPARSIVWKVILPGALPGILAGFRISASIALMLVVSAEMIGARYGIGAFMLQAGNLMQTDKLLAGVVMLSILGLAIAAVLGRLEAWLLRWR